VKASRGKRAGISRWVKLLCLRRMNNRSFERRTIRRGYSGILILKEGKKMDGDAS